MTGTSNCFTQIGQREEYRILINSGADLVFAGSGMYDVAMVIEKDS